MDGARIGFRPVESLLPHEETILSKAEKLLLDMKKEGVQRDPLIVDSATATVLDGMHRLSAFKKMRAEYVVCHLVDYSSPAVTLGRWVRVYEVARVDMVTSILENLGLNRKVKLAEVFELVESRKVALGVMSSAGIYVTQAKDSTLLSTFALVRQLDKVFSTLGWGPSFAPEDEVDIVSQNPKNLVALTPRLNKQDVLNAARTGRLFPCKTTMHVVDPRPVAIDFPLRDLMGRSPPTAELDMMLAQRKPRLTPPDTTYKGRRYKERLLMLREQ